MHTTANNPIQRNTTTIRERKHDWSVESRHITSTGHVLYMRCGTCGARRVNFQERMDLPPIALSSDLHSSSIHLVPKMAEQVD